MDFSVPSLGLPWSSIGLGIVEISRRLAVLLTFQAAIQKDDEDFLGDLAERLTEASSIPTDSSAQNFSKKALQLEVEDRVTLSL